MSAAQSEVTTVVDGTPGDSSAAESPPRTVRGLLAASAQRVPDAPALLAPGRAPLTHRHLGERVDATARALNALGLGRGDRVALVLPDGPELAVSFLAAATAATAAPLNPALTAAEVERLLGDLPARAVVVPVGDDSPARAVAAARGIPVVELKITPGAAGDFTLAGPPSARTVQAAAPRPDDVALVLHTSGTTGAPKRVPLTHRNLWASAIDRRNALRLGPYDRCVNLMPMVYVTNLATLLTALAAGASVVCPPRFDAPRFFAWLAEWRPTWFMAAPAMHRAILDRAPANAAAIAGSRLRFVETGGAPLPGATTAELEAAFGVPVLDGYGLTETAAVACHLTLPPHPPKPGPVGVSIGPEVAVVDEAGAPLPAGTAGEVVVRGAHVMGGYEGGPAANAGVFFPGGWFRTGDVGHLDGDGYLFLSGRRKEQINRGGEKVSPVEVEEALLAHPAVAVAAAFALPDERLGEEIAAAVVLHPGAAMDERALREAAAGRLAPFKVPRRVVVVDELPRGPTGKLQRIGLADALGLTAPARGLVPTAEPVAPRTAAEHLLAGIWAEVLGREGVGVDDDFLALGGDSILAAQVVARLRQALRLDLSVAAFFDAPTVAGMARVIEELLLEERERESRQPAAPAGA